MGRTQVRVNWSVPQVWLISPVRSSCYSRSWQCGRTSLISEDSGRRRVALKSSQVHNPGCALGIVQGATGKPSQATLVFECHASGLCAKRASTGVDNDNAACLNFLTYVAFLRPAADRAVSILPE
jgi:hypothetical protein